MTIDEAIARYKEESDKQRISLDKYSENLLKMIGISKTDSIQRADEYKQLAEWLEELKNYQNQHNAMCEKHKVKTIEDIYNKAIDDFVDKAYFVLGCEDSDIYCKETVNEIAEQLKEGSAVDNE